MAWNCQDCPWGGAWTRRAVRHHGGITGHQMGGGSGPDWLRLWWWSRTVRRWFR